MCGTKYVKLHIMKLRRNIFIMKGVSEMSFKPGVVAGPITEKDLCRLREAVCIQTEKIYDSCKEKDCIEDAAVLFRCPQKIQRLLRVAINVKARRAEICDVFADVQPVPFKRGFYTVSVKFFITVILDFFIPVDGCATRIVSVPGVIVFDKKVILFGSEGGVKIFKTRFVEDGIDIPVESALQQDNLPMSKIEVAEPIALAARIADVKVKCCCKKLPRSVSEYLERGEADIEGVVDLESVDDERNIAGVAGDRQVLASVGLFSIIKLVRFVQLLIPAFDFCVPNRECVSATDDDPCVLFDTIDFPVDEFFPPQKFDFPGALAAETQFRDETVKE